MPPVVVQGTPVANPHFSGTTSGTTAANGEWSGKGEKQAVRCRDPFFALLFYVNIAIILGIAGSYGQQAVNGTSSSTSQSDGTTSDTNYKGYVTAAAIIAVLSFGVSALGLMVLMCIPETMIKVSLIFVVILSGVWALMAIMSGAIFIGIIGVIFFALSVCYARAVWGRIPFASVNLLTACTAVKKHCTVVIVAYVFTFMAGLWSITWVVAFAGVYDQTYNCTDEQNADNSTCGRPNYGYMFLLFLSYFFGHQVIQYSIHVTVAGTVGEWWFDSGLRGGICDGAVCGSVVRTVTTSFGSICFGSLIVAFLQALRMLADMAQSEGDGGIMVCIAECILACLASIMEYFNKWAFIYVGLYGYSYINAGKNVFTLFRNRGWEAIIADDLVNNALFLTSLIVGGVMGSIAIVIAQTSDLFDDAGRNARLSAFMIGLIIGLVICSIALSTIASAVNAIIVLFAERPQEFQQNHPDLSNKMRQTWSQVYPGSV